MALDPKRQTVNKDLYKGIYFQKSDSRKMSAGAKQFDRYYTYRFKLNGKISKGAIGWHSEGRVPAEFYPDVLSVKENIRSGVGPQSYADLLATRKEEEASIPTLTKFWDVYLPNAKSTKGESSWSKEAQHFRDYIQPVAGYILIDQIEERHFAQVLANLNSLSDRTRKYVIGTFSRITKFAHLKKMRGAVPTTGHLFAKKDADNSRQRLISDDEKEYILSELENRSLPAYRITLFAFLTGCRFSEAANLRWVDVDDSSIRFMDTKNKEHRTIAASGAVLKLIKSIPRKGRYVFLADNGEQWLESPKTFKTVSKPFNKDRDDNDRIVFHSIRHYVATHLGRQLTVKELMSVLGWKSIQMAIRYMKPDEDRQRNALEILSGNREPAKVVNQQVINLGYQNQ